MKRGGGKGSSTSTGLHFEQAEETCPHAVVDLDAIRHNCTVLRKAAAGRQLFVVVKADAYGHGLLKVALAVADLVDGLCVFDTQDGIELRAAGVRLPIMVMAGFHSAQELADQARFDLWAVVQQPWQVDCVKSSAQVPRRLFVKAQTGMHRLGIAPPDVPGIVKALHGLDVDLALMHHFACADEPGGNVQQSIAMQGLVEECALPYTASNSAATLLCPAAGEEFVRCGIALYGSSPAYGNGVTAASLGLQPALSLRSKVIAVQDVAKGDGVGYGQRWRAPSDAQVAVVKCGYADGYPRVVPDGTMAHIDDRPVPVVGRVSMEMLTVDVTGLDVATGAEVELWGAATSVDEVAAAAGTIGYELLAALPARVPRMYRPDERRQT